MDEDRSSTRPPALTGVLETCLYFTDEQRTERFYAAILGMRLLDREPGRSLFFRAGRSVFLLFRASASLRGATLPPHGASGAVHTCFEVAPEQYEPWKEHLSSHGVAVVQEARWERGLSFYFHDPDQNLLEIANIDIWHP